MCVYIVIKIYNGGKDITLLQSNLFFKHKCVIIMSILNINF